MLYESEPPQRQQWANTTKFVMCCITMSIGLGNIWRFPFVAYENGGGAFLVPYLLVLALIGRPLYYLELTLGQFGGRGNIRLFSALGKGFAGIGASQTFCSIIVATYYCCIMAIALFYFSCSFQSRLPWSHCRPEWEGKCIDSATNNTEKFNPNYSSSAELFFLKYVIREKENIDDGLGMPDWRLTLCLLFSWLLVCLILIEGEISGKVYYFLAFFPYFIIFIILGIASSLDGAYDGIVFFLKPNWSKFLDIKVWFNAVSQCFFSLGMGFGIIIMFASYSAFDSNINLVAIIIAVVDIATSIISGITIFSVLGHLAFELKADVSQVVKSGGVGLVFISYSTALSHIKFAPYVISVIFFLMLFVLGLSIMVAFQQVVNGQITDYYPNIKHWQVAAMTSVAGFMLGLVYITPGGLFIFDLVDKLCVSVVIYVVTAFEIFILIYVYGLQNFCWDVEFMTLTKVNLYWRFTWGIIAPISLLIIFVCYIATLKKLTYRGVDFPVTAAVCGWLVVLFGILLAPGVAAYQLFKNRNLGWSSTCKEAFNQSRWGPVNRQNFTEWKAFKEDELQERRRDNKCVKILRAFFGK